MHTINMVLHILGIAVLIAFIVTVVEICIQGKKHFLLKREHGENEVWLKRTKERLKVLRKCWRMLLRPLPKVVGVVVLWRVLYNNELYFPERFETIGSAALILVVSVLYGLIYSEVLRIAFERLQKLRGACRMPDWLQFSEVTGVNDHGKEIKLSQALRTYVLLKDENLPPPLRALVIMPSLFLMGLIMAFKYPNALCGVCSVACVAYLLLMFYMVLIEVDKVFSGLYRTKIPAHWKDLNVKEVRHFCRKIEQEWYQGHTNKWDHSLTHGGDAAHDDDEDDENWFVVDLLRRLNSDKT